MDARSVETSLYAEVLALVCRTYAALDAGQADIVVRCFAEDGVWHRPDGPHAGPDAIRAVVTGRPDDQTTAHCVANLRLRSDGSTYVAEYYLSVFGSSPTIAPRLFNILDCTDELAAEGDGLRVRSKRTSIRMNFQA